MCNPDLWIARYEEAMEGRLGWTVREVDGDLVVETDKGRFVVGNHAPRDPEFLHVYSIWDVPEDVDRLVLLEIAAAVSREAKGMAVVVLEDDGGVVFTHEAVVAGPQTLPTVEHLATVLPRVRGMMWNAVAMWTEKLQAHVDTVELAGIEIATRAAYPEASDGSPTGA